MVDEEEVQVEVADFVSQWGLDDAMGDVVRDLPPDIRTRVLTGFRPNGETRNVNARLRAFIKSVSTATVSGSCENSNVEDSHSADDPVSAFCQHWSLPEESATMLQQLTPELQARVLQDFRPNGDTLNPAGRLRAFVRSVVATASQDVDPALQFCQHWGLAEDSLQMLHGLQPDVLQRVLTGFTPNADTENVGGRLRAFVRSVLSSSQEVPSAASVVVPPVAPNARQLHPKAQTSYLGPDIEEFLHRWGLGADSASMLEALPADILPVVLAEFTPKGDTRNTAGRLAAFARSVISKRGGDSAFGVAPSPEPTLLGGLLTEPVKAELFSEFEDPEDVMQEPEDDLVGFTLRWGLGEESLTFLRDLPRDVRSRVLEGFSPNEDTKNPEARLRAFAKRIMDSTFVAASPVVQDPVLHFAQTWGLDSSTVQFLRTLQPEVLSKVLTEFTPDGTTVNLAARLRGFARGVAQRATGSGVPVAAASPALPPPCAATVASIAKPVAIRSPLDGFAARWGLGPASMAMLTAQPHEVIETVLTDFQPPRDTVNIDGRLQGFIRSVAAARHQAPAAPPQVSALPPLKRPRALTQVQATGYYRS